jgi:hypothetical protein
MIGSNQHFIVGVHASESSIVAEDPSKSSFIGQAAPKSSIVAEDDAPESPIIVHERYVLHLINIQMSLLDSGQMFILVISLINLTSISNQAVWRMARCVRSAPAWC